jgi:hypothetical protein
MTDWVTVKEAVGILGMSERTIRRYIAEGKLRSRLENGRRLVYAKGHDNGISPDRLTSVRCVTDAFRNFDLLLAEKDARIQQLEEQVDRLTQLLAMAQKTASELTEQNQLLLEDRCPKKRWYHRLLVWSNAYPACD